MDYERLITGIGRVNWATQTVVTRTVNHALSVRNWLIGAYIIEYEQNGLDRARYGDQLLERVAGDLRRFRIKGFSRTNLKNCRTFAIGYPALANPATSAQLLKALNLEYQAIAIGQTASDQLQITDLRLSQGDMEAFQLPISDLTNPFPSLNQKNEEAQPLAWQNDAYYLQLFLTLPWSSLLILTRLNDPLKRAFYELESMKGGWSSRELKRQIDSMLYERVGFSQDKHRVMALANEGRLVTRPETILRDPYVLEFLGLEERASYSESDLEQALIDHLQSFMLELGRDFCFVDRQFRMPISGRHYYLDLLFFHRSLRCLVAVDLKIGSFRPEYAGQMNFYLNYLKEEVALPDENPPVGILLCSEKNVDEVRFATAGLDAQLFVSRYLVKLPSEEQLKEWLRLERARIEVQIESDESVGEDR
ncbi:MAG: PDDEXK nuclease domain-containing protein [Cyanobacteria bacterium J06635_1]